MNSRFVCLVVCLSTLAVGAQRAAGQAKAPAAPPAAASGGDAAVAGSIVEDRAARKLIEAGDARLEADEEDKAVEIWRSVIERYPRSKVRYDAHMRLGKHLLEKKRAFDEARGHFEKVSEEANTDTEQRVEAILKTGVCFYEGRHYGPSFKVLRQVIEEFPASANVNDAYYYIGLGHFKLGHYSRAIEALEKVGTAFSGKDAQIEKVEAGKRLYLKIDDQDLAILLPGETISVKVKATSGDEETVECYPIGRQVRVVLGSIPTLLGRPAAGNKRLEIRGGDKIEVTYIDSHTAKREFDQQRISTVEVVGSAETQITDGSFQDTLAGVVIGKQANLQIKEADADRTDAADSLKAIAEIWREKTQEELDVELAALAAKGQLPDPSLEGEQKPLVDKYKKIDQTEVVLAEIKQVPPAPEVEHPLSDETGSDLQSNPVGTEKPASETPAPPAPNPAPPAPDANGNAAAAEPAPPAASAAPAAPEVPVTAAPGTPIGDAKALANEIESSAAEDPSFHSGIFRGSVAISEAAEPIAGDAILQAKSGDLMRLRYLDEVNLAGAPAERVAEAKCIEGNLGNVRVTKTDISDTELRISTQLRTAEALTNIGNHYKEFGLQVKANGKYSEALSVAEEVLADARKLGGNILEQAYVQLWRTYFAMENFNLAVAMSQRLMREFPESTFADEAMLQQGQAFRKQGNLAQAISLYSSVLRLNDSPLKGEAQFGVAECYEEMAKAAPAAQNEALFDRAFVEYQKVYEQFPESGRVGDAVAKMANFYYQKQDYSRAVDVFENVLADYPDANFLDVILFNYGRCLYRLERKGEARKMFDQLINEFPESDVASEAKRISEALVKAGF